MINEFKQFIMRGNVLDMAVGIIIGAAFATIVASLTDDLIMPVIGAIFGGADFSSYFTVLGTIPADFKGDATSYAALKEAGVAVLGWGQFLGFLALVLAASVGLYHGLEKPAQRWLNRHPPRWAAPAPQPAE